MKRNAIFLCALLACSLAAGEEAKQDATKEEAVEKEFNPDILAMADNSWLKMSPKEPDGRNYSGCCWGDWGSGGRIWYFGGAHKSYPKNDVVFYDPAENQWTQATEGEMPDAETMKRFGGGRGATKLTPKGRPHTTHTYQQVCWQPDRRKFFAFMKAGIWEFDPEKKEWLHLINGYENPEKTPISYVGTNHVVYDPGLGVPVLINKNGIFKFDHEEREWVKLGASPQELKKEKYSTYVPEWKQHLISLNKSSWFKLDAATCKTEEIKDVPEGLKGIQALSYDPVGKVVIALSATTTGEGRAAVSTIHPWAFDPATGKFEELKPQGPAPVGKGSGKWAPLWYDPDHSAHFFLYRTGQSGCETWFYRYKKTEAENPAP